MSRALARPNRRSERTRQGCVQKLVATNGTPQSPATRFDLLARQPLGGGPITTPIRCSQDNTNRNGARRAPSEPRGGGKTKLRCLCGTATTVEDIRALPPRGQVLISFCSLFTFTSHHDIYRCFCRPDSCVYSLRRCPRRYCRQRRCGSNIYPQLSCGSFTTGVLCSKLTVISVCFSWGSDHVPLQTGEPYGNAVLVQ